MHLLGLLSTRCNGPRRHSTAEKRYELASRHCRLPKPEDGTWYLVEQAHRKGSDVTQGDVRFGSKADTCGSMSAYPRKRHQMRHREMSLRPKCGHSTLPLELQAADFDAFLS